MHWPPPMPDARPHQIWRQELILRVPSSAPAGQLQFDAQVLFERDAKQVLEHVLDDIAGPERLLRLERVELDLGCLPRENWQRVLAQRLEVRLRQALSQPSGRGPHATAAGLLASGGATSAPQAQLDAFLFFLEAGRLPWWEGSGRGRGGWDIDAERLVDSQPLRRLLRENTAALQRFVHGSGEDLLERVATAWGGVPHAREVLARCAPSGEASARIRRWRTRAWCELLELVVAPGGISQVAGARLLAQLLDASAPSLSAVATQPDPAFTSAAISPREHAWAEASRSVVHEPWRSWLEVGVRLGLGPRSAALVARPQQEPAAGSTGSGDERATSPRQGEGHDRASRSGDPVPAPEAEAPRAPAAPCDPTAEAPPPSHTRARGRTGRPRESASEAVAVSAAGLVIFHPFLGELFRSLGLLADERFRDAEARAVAVHSIAYLAFGRCDVAEYELLVPKLLCAMAWEEPLPPLELDDVQRAACDELVRAVLHHWSALKSTSSDWLREVFLLRPGVLEAVDQGWSLNVEHRAQDVLLGKLPWGIGLIRLPWMQRLLHVSWT
jgi:hypothetical protein